MKKYFALLSAIMMLGAAASCSDKGKSGDKKENSGSVAETTEPAPVGNGTKKIGIAMPTNTLERWTRDGEFLKEKFENAGYEVILKYSDYKPELQNDDIQEMIDSNVDLLLIAAVEGASISETVDQAKEKNIAVIAYDRLIMNTYAISYYVSFDNYSVGVLQGEYVRDALDLDNSKEPHNIELVAGDASDNNAKFFFNGAYGILKPYVESGKLNILSGKKSFEQVATEGWSKDTACENMRAKLAVYYADGASLDAVVCANDSTALGVENAISTDYKGDNIPVITGQDGDIANLKNIVDGTQAMTVFKNFNDEATVAFEVSTAVLAGKKPDAKLLADLSAPASFDSGSYSNGVMYVPAYLLIPSVITKDNLQDMVDTGLYKWDSSKKYLEAVEKSN